MEYFMEGILELIFGLAKDAPERMPDIEYKSTFVVKNTTKKMVLRIIASAVIAIALSVGCFFVDMDTRILYFVLIILFACIAVFAVDALSFKCVVNEHMISLSSFFDHKKCILWEDIICVRKCESTNEDSVWIVLYGKDNKRVLDVSSQMENAWYIIKMAQHKEIEIREEKDLTLKQMRHL